MNDSRPLGPQQPTSSPDPSRRLEQEQKRVHDIEEPSSEALRGQRATPLEESPLRPPEVALHEADESTL
jgi:hypothetical protein